jgi:hypothetical protein
LSGAKRCFAFATVDSQRCGTMHGEDEMNDMLRSLDERLPGRYSVCRMALTAGGGAAHERCYICLLAAMDCLDG